VAADAACHDPSVLALQELTQDDWALWRALRIEATTDEPDAFGSTLAAVVATTEAQWRARFGARSLHLIARRGDAAVGMAAVNHGFELGSVWVRPAARGSGTAHRLIDAALRWSASREARAVRLAVRESNTAAIGLYRAYGFVEVGDDYLNPERVYRLILMARALEVPPSRMDRPISPNHGRTVQAG
jgi:ribosomal protein S18 acetylase RimI-like enzyme